MRVLGVIIFLVGAAGTGMSVSQMLRQGRPRDLFFAALATTAAVLSIVGLVLAFVPGFLS